MKKSVLLLLVSFSTSFICTAQEQRFTTSDMVTLYVNVKGKGTPCLYIHGGPGAGSYWMEKFSGEMLEERFKMIYVDLRGVGRSSSPSSSDFSLERMVTDFEEIRKHLGIDSWVIMGHSFSGTILTAYAFKHPGSIRGMMMFNCVLDINESINKSWIPYACSLLDVTDTSYYTNDTITIHDKLNKLFSLLNTKDLAWKMAFRHKENSDKLNATYDEIPNWNRDFGRIGISHPDYLINFKPSTSQIKKPVLFFYGKTDWTVGPAHYQGVNFPTMLLWGSDVGHFPFLENKEDLRKSIDTYLNRYDL